MILLTALPRTGKTTAIKKIIDSLGRKNCGGFYTKEIRENGERVGFEIITLSGKRGILAHVNIQSEYKISRYGVNLNEFERLCLNELKQVMANDKLKYLIIDEIGPMQLFSEEFKELLYELLNTSKIVLGTIFYLSHDWLDKFKKEINVNLIEITLENRDKIPLEIIEMVTKEDSVFQKKIVKAKKYLNEIDRFVINENKTIIYSEHGVRTVECKDDEFFCDCEYFNENGTCSHIISVINRMI
ncbi:MAG: nucleoside-triphosphatase [Clostridia bacterium]|nr:nucleoside-triphosphatase [Clostridia bacterium]